MLVARVRRASSSHGATACSSDGASSPEGTSEPTTAATLVRFEHDQNALGAGELRDFVDEEFVQFLGAAQLVEAHPRIDEALERRSHVSFAAKVCVASLGGQAPPSRVRDPRLDDRAVRVDLVQVAAAQALVAQRADAFEQQLVGGFERRERLPVLALGGQRAVVPPPHMRGRQSRAERSAFTRTIEVGGSPRGIERGLALTLHQMRPAEVDQDEYLEARLLQLRHPGERLLQVGHRRGAFALGNGDQRAEPYPAELPDAVDVHIRSAPQGFELGTVPARGLCVADESGVACEDGQAVCHAVEIV